MSPLHRIAILVVTLVALAFVPSHGRPSFSSSGLHYTPPPLGLQSSLGLRPLSETNSNGNGNGQAKSAGFPLHSIGDAAGRARQREADPEAYDRRMTLFSRFAAAVKEDPMRQYAHEIAIEDETEPDGLTSRLAQRFQKHPARGSDKIKLKYRAQVAENVVVLDREEEVQAVACNSTHLLLGLSGTSLLERLVPGVLVNGDELWGCDQQAILRRVVRIPNSVSSEQPRVELGLSSDPAITSTVLLPTEPAKLVDFFDALSLSVDRELKVPIVETHESDEGQRIGVQPSKSSRPPSQSSDSILVRSNARMSLPPTSAPSEATHLRLMGSGGAVVSLLSGYSLDRLRVGDKILLNVTYSGLAGFGTGVANIYIKPSGTYYSVPFVPSASGNGWFAQALSVLPSWVTDSSSYIFFEVPCGSIWCSDFELNSNQFRVPILPIFNPTAQSIYLPGQSIPFEWSWANTVPPANANISFTMCRVIDYWTDPCYNIGNNLIVPANVNVTKVQIQLPTTLPQALDFSNRLSLFYLKLYTVAGPSFTVETERFHVNQPQILSYELKPYNESILDALKVGDAISVNITYINFIQSPVFLNFRLFNKFKVDTDTLRADNLVAFSPQTSGVYSQSVVLTVTSSWVNDGYPAYFRLSGVCGWVLCEELESSPIYLSSLRFTYPTKQNSFSPNQQFTLRWSWGTFPLDTSENIEIYLRRDVPFLPDPDMFATPIVLPISPGTTSVSVTLPPEANGILPYYFYMRSDCFLGAFCTISMESDRFNVAQTETGSYNYDAVTGHGLETYTILHKDCNDLASDCAVGQPPSVCTLCANNVDVQFTVTCEDCFVRYSYSFSRFYIERSTIGIDEFIVQVNASAVLNATLHLRASAELDKSDSQLLSRVTLRGFSFNIAGISVSVGLFASLYLQTAYSVHAEVDFALPTSAIINAAFLYRYSDGRRFSTFTVDVPKHKPRLTGSGTISLSGGLRPALEVIFGSMFNASLSATAALELLAGFQAPPFPALSVPAPTPTAFVLVGSCTNPHYVEFSVNFRVNLGFEVNVHISLWGFVLADLHYSLTMLERLYPIMSGCLLGVTGSPAYFSINFNLPVASFDSVFTFNLLNNLAQSLGLPSSVLRLRPAVVSPDLGSQYSKVTVDVIPDMDTLGTISATNYSVALLPQLSNPLSPLLQGSATSKAVATGFSVNGQVLVPAPATVSASATGSGSASASSTASASPSVSSTASASPSASSTATASVSVSAATPSASSSSTASAAQTASSSSSPSPSSTGQSAVSPSITATPTATASSPTPSLSATATGSAVAPSPVPSTPTATASPPVPPSQPTGTGSGPGGLDPPSDPSSSSSSISIGVVAGAAGGGAAALIAIVAAVFWFKKRPSRKTVNANASDGTGAASLGRGSSAADSIPMATLPSVPSALPSQLQPSFSTAAVVPVVGEEGASAQV